MTAQADTKAATATDAVPGATNATQEPQVTTPPAASQEPATPDVDKDIQTAEKRIADKLAYLEKLQSELSNYDRDITEHRKKLAALEQQQQPPQPQEPAPAPQPDTQSGDAARAAAELGISDQEFIELLNAGNGQATAKLVEIAERRATEKIMSQLPQMLNHERTVNSVRERVERIREAVGEENFQHFHTILRSYQSEGFAPTPEHLHLELEFGPLEMQRKLMDLGRQFLQLQQAQATPQQQAQQPGQTTPNVFPMAPGGGSPTAPQATQQQGDGKAPLRKLGWNVGG